MLVSFMTEKGAVSTGAVSRALFALGRSIVSVCLMFFVSTVVLCEEQEKTVILMNHSAHTLFLQFDCPAGFIHRLPDHVTVSPHTTISDIMTMPGSDSCIIRGKIDKRHQREASLWIEVASQYQFCVAEKGLSCAVRTRGEHDIEVEIEQHKQ